jgi:hypothetical protein
MERNSDSTSMRRDRDRDCRDFGPETGIIGHGQHQIDPSLKVYRGKKRE